MKNYLRSSSFLIGSLFIVGLLIVSFMYSFYLKKLIQPPPTFFYNSEGRVIDTFPFPPSLHFLFGVDRHGRDVFWSVIDGAKFTIVFAIIISFFRVLLGMVFGVIYGVYLQRFRFLFQAFERACRFVPAVFLVFMFLNVNFFNPTSNGFSLLISQIMVLTVVALPPLTSVIGNEVNFYQKNEFITSTRIIGGSNFWVIKKHIIPFLRSRILLMFVQQIIQVLLLMVHLGVFKLVIGDSEILNTGEREVTVSLSNEWSGLIGLSYAELMLDKWIVIGPSIGFILTILAFTMIKKGIENSTVRSKEKKRKRSSKKLKNEIIMDFSFVKEDR
ncbi:peptide ABC transporter permease [Bacillus sp. AFS053548]|uniref:peptide ABC transporter permease n=1 Tax=Bacillus sp. AFS053548 TaxID=2033505 RepID=UPI000BFCDCF6|nr:peptide ABC transporter permease [Bacillus sp. AFS053548]PGM53852.1 peptide ABC transporter permease [Bacillus sp. AFS053548]